jgi:hypothetical protein
VPRALTSKSVLGSTSDVVTATCPARCRIASWFLTCVPHVLLDKGRSSRVLGEEPLEVALGAGAAQVVQERHVPSPGDEVDRGVDAEEPGAACDEDPPPGPFV